LNSQLGRRGKVWGSRYHAHRLKTPREVRVGLAYVLLNFRKHFRAGLGIDPRSSGRWFEGWAHAPVAARDGPLARPRTWLVRVGWRRAGGPIELGEGPLPTHQPGLTQHDMSPPDAAGARHLAGRKRP
jgi:hypothetical protein